MLSTTRRRAAGNIDESILGEMFFQKVKFLMTQVERPAAKTLFASVNSPFVGGIIGAIDCTHIAILAPKNHEEAFVNHHGNM